ncbi:hypothetical protein QBC39DRAFT_435003 [Podospora conica]|nr:hypothetical protein QBC39DRAFT_435003 [Schizothecium conicum]
MLHHAMGELRDKLRSKFPRRHSGLAHLSATKSNAHSISESESQSRPLSQCTTNPRQQPDPSSPGEGPRGAGSLSLSRHSTSRDGAAGEAKFSHSPATIQERGPTTIEARDRVRQEETKQEITATPTSADVRRAGDGATDDTDTDADRNRIGSRNSGSDSDGRPAATVQQSNPPADRLGATAVPAAADSTRWAKDATNGSSMHSTNPATPASNVKGNDQRSVTAKLDSITEVASDASITVVTSATNPSKTAAATDAATAAEAQRPAPLSDSGAVTNDPGLTNNNAVGIARARSTGPPLGSAGQSTLLPARQTTFIRNLLNAAHGDDLDRTAADLLLPIPASMVTRKIWVKRPGASATLITISEDDLVDDVRDMILRRYANSLGRHFDAPDLTLRIAPREPQRQERQLAPDEPMARTLDAYFPGGQTVDEALIIDIPVRRTPRASPRAGPPHAQHLTSAYYEDSRPPEAGTDYFGPAALVSNPPSAAGVIPSNGGGHPHAISVLSTGQVPQIPSPGGTRSSRTYRDRPDRPRLGRQHTSSPTILNIGGHPATITITSSHDPSTSGQVAPPAPPMPTPPVQEQTPVQIQRVATPPPRAASPRPAIQRPKKKKTLADHTPLPALLRSGGVPPINVLIVEDNIINLRLLEAFIKRLKVRWQTAMNGQEAVTKWRAGGFHLVLMDIQLPIMNGLEATREIRRLERSNSIGAFSSTPATTPGAGPRVRAGKGEDRALAPNNLAAKDAGEAAEEDKLQNRELFKSPVIIVALTASSLQSDRHEALAAGCNDFLTKPVTYVWLERKVKEWGCMQALIDPDGWRNWKESSQNGDGGNDASSASKKMKKTKTNRLSQAASTSEPQ